MATRFRRKNRQIKMVVDVPEEYDSDEVFMEDFMDKMDGSAEWQFLLGEDNDIPVPISRVTLGEIEIEPEEEED